MLLNYSLDFRYHVIHHLALILVIAVNSVRLFFEVYVGRAWWAAVGKVTSVANCKVTHTDNIHPYKHVI